MEFVNGVAEKNIQSVNKMLNAKISHISSDWYRD